MTLAGSKSLEAHIAFLLKPLFGVLELEPVADDSDALTTYEFLANPGRGRLQRTGALTLHFYGATREQALDRSYDNELAVEDALGGTKSDRFTIIGASFESRLPELTDAGEYINEQCIYNIQYTIRRA